MKKLLIGLLTLGSASSFAIMEQPLELSLENKRLSKIKTKVISGKSTKNADGSTTLIKPRRVRGNRKILIHSTGADAFIGTCVAAGFDHFVKESNREEFNLGAMGDRVMLDKQGNVTGRRTSPSSISEISCYNGEYKLAIKSDGFIEGKDTAVTIINPKLVRGSIIYRLAYYSPDKAPSYRLDHFNGVCVAAGFDKYLNHSSYGIDETGERTRSILLPNGDLSKNTRISETLSEITCVKKGGKKTVLVDEARNYYFRKD